MFPLLFFIFLHLPNYRATMGNPTVSSHPPHPEAWPVPGRPFWPICHPCDAPARLRSSQLRPTSPEASRVSPGTRKKVTTKCLRQTPCQGEIRPLPSFCMFWLPHHLPAAVTRLPVTSVGRQPLAHLFQGAFSLPELLQQSLLPSSARASGVVGAKGACQKIEGVSCFSTT